MPLCIAAISPLSSTIPTVNPLNLGAFIPSLITLLNSLIAVVLPVPGLPTINVLYILLLSKS